KYTVCWGAGCVLSHGGGVSGGVVWVMQGIVGVIGIMVEKMGVEPTTSAMRMPRSSQLSYFPVC
ncbi:MAG: hypothetical protein K0S68_844, partial [Candidatus Saccharibacteria bacterium]|nr:hypothetical protein [Candidatus Saccharibacteria bacterium]